MRPDSFHGGITMLAGLVMFAANVLFAETISLSGPTTQWKVVQFASTNDFDYLNDSQAGISSLDIVGSATHAAIYNQYDDRGTTNAVDDLVGFRVRLGGGDNNNEFSGVLLVAIDANFDGKLDLFLSADGRNSGRSVKIWAPGTGANVSPATTSISAPTNQKIYPFGTSNYNVTAVSPLTDPIPNLNTNINGDSKFDIFVSFALPYEDVRSEMLRISGIPITRDSPLRYLVFTLTQNSAINGDISGVNGGVNSTLTYTELGVFTTTTTLNNTPPFFGGSFADQFTSIGAPVGPIPFIIYDADTPLTNLTLTAVSSNTMLVPNENIMLSGSGSNRTVSITPAAGQAGLTRIQLILSDGALISTNGFLLTVTNVDITAPIVGSIVRYSPSASLMNTSAVVVRVTFSEEVVNVDSSDFVATVSDDVSVGSLTVSAVSGTTYEVIITGITGDGSLRLDLKNGGTGIADLTGNLISGGFTSGEAYTVDHIAPAVPGSVGISDDTGSSNTDFVTTDATLLFSGSAESNGTVSFTVDGNLVGLASVDGAGLWTFDNRTNVLADGAYNVAVLVTDSAGNSSASMIVSLIIDTAIIAPAALDLAASSDSGSSATDNVTSVSTPTITGTAEAGSAVTLFGGTNVIGSAIAVDGTWSITSSSLTVGSHSITAVAVDLAGNVSAASLPLTISVVAGKPTISVISNATIPEDGVLGPVEIVLGDADSDPATLSLTAASSDTAVVTPENMFLSGAGSSRTLSVTPLANCHGTITITLTVQDEAGETATSELTLTIQSENDSPTINPISPILLVRNVTPTNIVLSGITAGAGENQPLVLAATASNTNLFEDISISYTSPESEGMLVLSLISNATGTATISLVVNDGASAVTNSFVVTVMMPVWIARQPASDATCEGKDVEFWVSAFGDGPLHYQWFFQGVELPGATNDTLSLSEAASFQAGQYQVRVSNPVSSVLTRPASLTFVTNDILRIVHLKVLRSDQSACLTLSGTVGQHAEVQGSFDLQQWTTLTNFVFTESCFQFIDPQAVQNYSKRLYRLAPR